MELTLGALHCSDDGRTDTRPPLLVTAAVDAIHLSKRLKLDEDMTMSGQVVWTGTSSMDIRMQLSQVFPMQSQVQHRLWNYLCLELLVIVTDWEMQGSAEEDTSLVALFTFVAREPLTQKAMAINPVAPSSQLERQRFAERQRVADARRAARKAANALPSTGGLPGPILIYTITLKTKCCKKMMSCPLCQIYYVTSTHE